MGQPWYSVAFRFLLNYNPSRERRSATQVHKLFLPVYTACHSLKVNTKNNSTI